MPVENDVRISTLAARGTPEHTFLRDADTDGNSRISTKELNDHIARGQRPRGVTQADVSAIKTSFLNTLAPGSASGVSVRGFGGGVVLPRQFALKEHVTTSLFGGTTFASFDVTNSSGTKIGHLERRWRSSSLSDALQNGLAPTFTLRNPNISDKDRNVIAEAKPVIIDTENLGNNFRNVIHIEDGAGNRIGTIRERWESTASSILQRAVFGKSLVTSYEILDANGDVIAQSDKGELLRTRMDISAGGRKVGTAERGFFNSLIRDSWSMDIQQDNTIDRRILLFVAAYKTWGDKLARAQAESRRRRNNTVLDAIFGN